MEEDKAATRLRLEEFYRVHNPEKLKDVTKILNKYAGKEDELFAKLAKSYGMPVPLVPSPSKEKSMATVLLQSSVENTDLDDTGHMDLRASAALSERAV